jgi:hypothetical protein
VRTTPPLNPNENANRIRAVLSVDQERYVHHGLIERLTSTFGETPKC